MEPLDSVRVWRPSQLIGSGELIRNSVHTSVSSRMDEALDLIRSGFGREGTARLARTLAEQRLTRDEDEWKQCIQDALAHPIREYVHADPFTFRAFAKPRGYAGDAVMMDYIYGYRQEELPAPVDQIFSYTTSESPAPRAIRARREILAQAIDHATAQRDGTVDVIAIAAGHLREMDLSAAATQGLVHITALDADKESLAVVEDAYGRLGARTLHGSVRQILSGKIRLEPSDLVYSAGLYDYLSEPVATRLTTMLFDVVRPGGTLLLANFLPDVPDVGYMESFMAWHLIYRTDHEMLELTDALPHGDVARIRQFHDALDNITFLEITKTTRP